MERKWWIVIAVAVGLVLCLALLVVLAAIAALGFLSARSVQVAPTVVSLTPSSVPITPTPVPAGETAIPGSTEAPTPAIDPETLAQLAEIEAQVSELRGLQSQGTFDISFPTTQAYKEIALAEFEEDYSPAEAQDDVRVLAALGLLPPEFDLFNMYVDLYSEGILGAYYNETKQMYVLLVSGKFGGVERQTYAHEYDHALQDQNYGIEALGLNDEDCELNSERCVALRGLIEGDATLLETQWLDTYGTQQDFEDIDDFYRDFTNEVYDRTPCYLRDDFYWPYDDGARFVEGLYDAGGWAAVDEAYANPPVSSEQVMHPALYQAGELPEVLPAPVLTETLGSGWRQIEANLMGEWYTQLILLEPFREQDQASRNYCTAGGKVTAQMEDAAAGWGGDAYSVYYNDSADQTVLAMLTTWDSDAEAVEFAAALELSGDTRFSGRANSVAGGLCWQAGDYGLSCLYSRESDTLWVIAPDEATMSQVVAAIPPFP